jgi:hypothetical protein
VRRLVFTDQKAIVQRHDNAFVILTGFMANDEMRRRLLKDSGA